MERIGYRGNWNLGVEWSRPRSVRVHGGGVVGGIRGLSALSCGRAELPRWWWWWWWEEEEEERVPVAKKCGSIAQFGEWNLFLILCCSLCFRNPHASVGEHDVGVLCTETEFGFVEDAWMLDVPSRCVSGMGEIGQCGSI